MKRQTINTTGVEEHLQDFIMRAIEKGARLEKEREKRQQEADAAFIAGLEEKVTSGKVLFYPACGFDWQIIKDFSDRCTTFLYADWHASIDEVAQSISEANGHHDMSNLRFSWNRSRECLAERFVTHPHLPEPAFLKPEERRRYEQQFQNWSNRQPWCRYVPIILTVDGQERILDLIYVSAEGVNTYHELFNRRGSAPKYLCIKNCGAGFGFNYTHFAEWDQPLGRAVLGGWRMHGHAPEYLITEHENHNWPWTGRVCGVTGATVFALPRGLRVEEIDH